MVMSQSTAEDRIPLSIEVRLGIFFVFLFLVAIILDPKPVILPPAEEVILPSSSTEIIRGDRSKMNVIFTFDGGSKDISSRKILKVLEKNNMKTTFFLTGDFVLTYPEVVREMKNAGHEIYNHTENHPYLTQATDREILLELDGMDRALRGTIDQSSKPYFRPPYGDRNDRVLKIAYGAGYQSVGWTVDALDWQESEGRTGDEVRSIILNSLAPGNIYLLHLGDSISGDLLEELINETEKRGYKIVSLKQGL